MNKFFTLLSSSALVAAVYAGAFSLNAAAQENVASLNPTSEWSAKAIGAQSDNAYCALSRSYDQNLVLTLGQSVTEEYSFAIDFVDGSLNPDKAYNITLQPGPGQIRAYEMMPASNRAMVIRIGYDDSFLKALRESNLLKAEIDGKNYNFAVSEFSKAEVDLKGCMETLKGGVDTKLATAKFKAEKVENAPPIEVKAKPVETPKVTDAPEKSIAIEKKQAVDVPRAPVVEEVVEVIEAVPEAVPAKPIVISRVSSQILPDAEEEAAKEKEAEDAQKLAAEKAKADVELEAQKQKQLELAEIAKKADEEARQLAAQEQARKAEDAKIAAEAEAAKAVAAQKAQQEAQKLAEAEKAKAEEARKLAEIEAQKQKQLELAEIAKKAAEEARQLAAQEQARKAEDSKIAAEAEAAKAIAAQKAQQEAQAELEKQKQFEAELQAQAEQEKLALAQSAVQDKKAQEEKDALKAENERLALSLKAQEEKIEQLNQVDPETQAEITRIRDRMQSLEQENRQLFEEARKARGEVDMAVVNTGNQALKKMREYEEKLEAAKTDNLKLAEELEELRRIDENNLVNAANGNPDIERATERYNEAQREIQRMSILLEQQRNAHKQEKQELEAMLFDPAVTDREQQRRFKELELKLAQAEAQLKSEAKTPQVATQIAAVEDAVVEIQPEVKDKTLPEKPVAIVSAPSIPESRISRTPDMQVDNRLIEQQQKAAQIQEQQRLQAEALKIQAERQKVESAKQELQRQQVEVARLEQERQKAESAKWELQRQQVEVARLNQERQRAELARQDLQAQQAELAKIQQETQRVELTKQELQRQKEEVARLSLQQQEAQRIAQQQQQAQRAAQEQAEAEAKQRIAAQKRVFQNAPQQTISAPVSKTAMGEGNIKQILDRSGVGVNGTVSQAAQGQYQWRAGQLSGQARVIPAATPGGVDKFAQNYIAQQKQKCQGDFASMAAPQITKGMAYDIACVGGSGDSSSAVIFTQVGNDVLMISHATSMENMDVAIDARDRIAGSL